MAPLTSKGTVRTPPEFTAKIRDLSSDLEKLVTSRFWHLDPVRGEIPIFEDREQCKSFTLELTREAMGHADDHPNLRGFTLVYNPKIKGNEQSSIPQTFFLKARRDQHNNVTEEVPGAFLPLGWLVEWDTKAGRKTRRTSNYVVVMNVATDPISLWLVHDYHPLDDELEQVTVRLGEQDYHNPGYWDIEPGVYFGINNPFGKDYKTINAKTPTFRQHFLGISSVPSVHKEVGVTGQELHNPTPASKFGISSSSVEAGELAKPQGSPGVTKRGYFDLPDQFDVALLAQSIYEWDPLTGLDATRVKSCLEYTHIHLGESLLAQTVMWISQVKRVKFADLEGMPPTSFETDTEKEDSGTESDEAGPEPMSFRLRGSRKRQRTNH